MSNQVSQVQTGSMVLNVDSMRAAVDFSQLMASGAATVPKHLQKNQADCLAVTMQAMQWGMNPFAVAQKTHLVSGTLGYEAQLVNAVISSSSAIEGRFHYRYSDEKTWEKNNNAGSWVQVGAILKGETEIQWGEKVYPSTQSVKNSPLWKTDEKQQCSYLAVKKWARMFCPAVMLGVYTSDEIQEFEPSEPRDITPKKQSAMRMPDAIEQAKEPESEPAETVNTETGEVTSEPVEQELSESDLEWIMVIKEKPEMASQLDEHPEYKEYIMSKIK